MGKTCEQAIHTESIKSQKTRKRTPPCGNNWRTVNLNIKDLPAHRSCGKTGAGLVPDGEMYRDGPPPLRPQYVGPRALRRTWLLLSLAGEQPRGFCDATTSVPGVFHRGTAAHVLHTDMR